MIGREITVAIVNGLPLPVVEVRPKSGFYDYAAKYTKGMTEYIVPAEHRRGYRRKGAGRGIDRLGAVRPFRLREDRYDRRERETPLVIDINTSPGMTETSLVPKAWAHLGKTFDQLVEEILERSEPEGMKRDHLPAFPDAAVPSFRADGDVPLLAHGAGLSSEEHQDKGGRPACRIGDPREDLPLPERAAFSRPTWER